jgi:hypothetical protein
MQVQRQAGRQAEAREMTREGRVGRRRTLQAAACGSPCRRTCGRWKRRRPGRMDEGSRCQRGGGVRRQKTSNALCLGRRQQQRCDACIHTYPRACRTHTRTHAHTHTHTHKHTLAGALTPMANVSVANNTCGRAAAAAAGGSGGMPWQWCIVIRQEGAEWQKVGVHNSWRHCLHCPGGARMHTR